MSAAGSLLGPGDPPPVEIINAEGRSPILLTCDHASPAVPKALGTLGLSAAQLNDHIGWDIGAAAVTRRLARRLDAPAVLAGYSRLVIDCNRPHHSKRQPGSIADVSDRVAIPGNRGIAPEAAEERAKSCFWPYHHAIEDILNRFEEDEIVPAYLAIHSFTPVMDGFKRPWNVGVCWQADGRIARPLLAALEARGDLVVGDNEPYGFFKGSDYGIPVHAGQRGLPHVLVEIRNDQLRDEAGQDRWAAILAEGFEAVLVDPAIRRIEHYPELIELLDGV